MVGAVTGNAFGTAGRRAAGTPVKAGGTGLIATSGWNPNDKSSGLTITAGNILSKTVADTTQTIGRGTKFVTTGRLYVEFLQFNSNSNSTRYPNCGVANAAATFQNYLGSDSNSAGLIRGIFYGPGNANGTAIFTTSGSDVFGMAYDGTNLYFAQNGVWYGGKTPGTGATGMAAPTGPLALAAGGYSIGDGAMVITNAALMIYGPPAGFQAWG